MAFVSLFSSAHAALPPGVVSAQWLQQNCGAVSALQRGEKPGIGSAAESGNCIGYLGALVETSSILNPSLPPHARVCITGEVKPAMLAKVILDYIQARPAVVQDPRLVVSLAALAAKYPCPK